MNADEVNVGGPAKLRTLQRGQTERETPVDEFVGPVVDDEIRQLMTRMERAFRSNGETFRGTQMYRDLLHEGANEGVQYALEHRQDYIISNTVGETSETTDLSGLRTTRKLRQAITRPAYVAYIYGQMGNGKTDFALLLSEVWRDEREAEGYDVELASNVKTWERAETVTEYDELTDWMGTEDGTDPENSRRLFVFDEASSHASGYSGDANETRENLGKLVNLMRKHGTSMIIIGHTGKDVHPDVLRKSTHIIRKKGLKEAEIYRRETEVGGEMINSLDLDLDGIPPTNEVFSTHEASSWSWGQSDREDRICRMLQLGLKQSDIADVEGISAARVSQIVSDLDGV